MSDDFSYEEVEEFFSPYGSDGHKDCGNSIVECAECGQRIRTNGNSEVVCPRCGAVLYGW